MVNMHWTVNSVSLTCRSDRIHLPQLNVALLVATSIANTGKGNVGTPLRTANALRRIRRLTVHLF